MKIPLHHLLICATLALAPAASAASVSDVDVVVKKDGKAVYKTKTDASGSFSTGSVEPGSYNLEFRAPQSLNLQRQQLTISVTAGKDAPRQSNAQGKHLQSGVAMAVDVSRASKLTGQIATSGLAKAENSGPAPEGMEKVRANVKVINGKRHIWVPGPIGSNIGGRWVEEGTEGAVLSTSNKKGGDAEVLRHVQDQSANIGRR